jgi:adenosylcobinamide-GDP ribazoletransferase
MFNVVQHQFFLFKLAIVFLTRLPVSIKREVNDSTLNLATGYFGLVGFFIATLNASVLFLSMLVLPISIAVLLSMVFGLMLTGAFHEDGLADTADGFGGGWLPEQKLTIMKDSRLGTYGASALCVSGSIVVSGT